MSNNDRMKPEDVRLTENHRTGFGIGIESVTAFHIPTRLEATSNASCRSRWSMRKDAMEKLNKLVLEHSTYEPKMSNDDIDSKTMKKDVEIAMLRDALKSLLDDTQHKHHNCGEDDCPVLVARNALNITAEYAQQYDSRVKAEALEMSAQIADGCCATNVAILIRKAAHPEKYTECKHCRGKGYLSDGFTSCTCNWCNGTGVSELLPKQGEPNEIHKQS